MSIKSIAVIGHSVVAARQQLFIESLGALIPDSLVWGIGPRSWGKHRLIPYIYKNVQFVPFETFSPGNMFSYSFIGLSGYIKKIKPDLLYCFGELSSRIATEISNLNIPYYMFIWENILKPRASEYDVLKKASGIICGNTEAKNLIPDSFHNKCYILPQVGIDTDLFTCMPCAEKKVDVIYVGRMVDEKGIEIISKGCKKLNLNVDFISGLSYEHLPARLNQGKIFASLPMTTPRWKEQSGSYSNLEAMACGLPVITTKCGAIPEYLGDHVIYCRENDVEDFMDAAKKLLSDSKLYKEMSNRSLRKANEYSNQKIARGLLNVFHKTES